MSAILSEREASQVASPGSIRTVLTLRRSGRLLAAWCITVLLIWTLAFVIARRAPFTMNGHDSAKSAVEALSAWDGTVYTTIAQQGYSVTGDDRRFFNFFPLYPAIIRSLGGHLHATLAGVLLSQLLALASILLMSWIVHGSKPAPLLQEPGFWMLASPFGFFLLCAYTEALFLFLTLVHYAAFRSKRTGVSFLAGFLAGLTRPTAIVLPVMLGSEALRRWRRNEEWKTALVCATAPALGVAAYVLGFVRWMTGDAAAYTKISNHYFTRTLVIPLSDYVEGLGLTLLHASHSVIENIPILLRVISTTVVIAVLIARRKNLEPALLAYSVATLLFVHAIFPQTGTGRFELVLFPVFFAIAASNLPRMRGAWVIIAASGYLWVKAFMQFATWHWLA